MSERGFFRLANGPQTARAQAANISQTIEYCGLNRQLGKRLSTPPRARPRSQTEGEIDDVKGLRRTQAPLAILAAQNR
jgi:hypothetical protein